MKSSASWLDLEILCVCQRLVMDVVIVIYPCLGVQDSSYKQGVVGNLDLEGHSSVRCSLRRRLTEELTTSAVSAKQNVAGSKRKLVGFIKGKNPGRLVAVREHHGACRHLSDRRGSEAKAGKVDPCISALHRDSVAATYLPVHPEDSFLRCREILFCYARAWQGNRGTSTIARKGPINKRYLKGRLGRLRKGRCCSNRKLGWDVGPVRIISKVEAAVTAVEVARGVK